MKFERSILQVAAFLLCGAFALPAMAQNQNRTEGQPIRGQISGQVRYAEGGNAAFDVLVSCDSFSGGLIGQERTDRTGRFRFTNLAPATYNLTIRVPGYHEEQQTVELLTTSSAYVQVQLKPDGTSPFANNLSPGVVNASIPLAAQKEFDKGQAALALQTKEGLAQAVQHFEKALSIYPRFVQAELKLGTAYMDLGQWDKADQALHKTIEIDPKAANALFALGELYIAQKKDEEAEKVLVQGLAIEDRSYQGHLALARAYWNLGQKTKDDAQSRPLFEKSYSHVNTALKLDPDLAQAHLVKGNLYLRARRAQDALHEFEEYLRLDPKGPFAEQTRGNVDKLKKALETKN
jgi:tetratricopeptide (TPR) repeat protein